ncbi:MAG: radical SAM protein [Candidatus Pacearchaeota archaeon]|nr:radical SAM protein [Candidatus Pacearchaeota archaeon]
MGENSGDLKIFLESQGGGIKEACYIPENLLYQDVDIKPDSEIILIGPDGGKRREKDDYFIPNLHNGLFRIHAFLYENQKKSTLLNCDVDNMSDAWEKIARYNPPFIGFSPYYDTMVNDLKNIEKAIDSSPNSVIIVGGFEASLNDQWRKLGGLIDIIVRGEGEAPLNEIIQRYKNFSQDKDVDKKEFLDYLKESIKTEDISGVSVLEKGKIAGLRCMKERIDEGEYQKINLNAFQKHLELSPIKKYWELSRAMFGGKKDSYFRFVTSDHCPYKCIFCQSSQQYSAILGKKSSPVRCVAPENIIEIIKSVSAKYPEMDIYVDDDNFLVKNSRAKKTLEMIIESKSAGEIRRDLNFQCRARTDSITPEICGLLKKAGFKIVSVGSESYSMKELLYMKKKTTPEKNLKAVKTLLKNGLDVAEDFLLYTPEVTADTFYENARGICRSVGKFGTDSSVNLFLSPLPSTELWGEGCFEKTADFPYKNLFKDKIMFRNPNNGYEYIGTEIEVPKLGIRLPHPEMVLVRDQLMREASLNAITYLSESVESLRKISGNTKLSRSFVTLSHLSATSKALYNLTKESRWKKLELKIKKSAVKLEKKKRQ